MNCYSFYEKYQRNDNEWWKLSEGEMQNLYDDAMGEIFGWEKTANEQIARAEAAESEVARLKTALDPDNIAAAIYRNVYTPDSTAGYLDGVGDAVDEIRKLLDE